MNQEMISMREYGFLGQISVLPGNVQEMHVLVSWDSGGIRTTAGAIGSYCGW
jgi:hypothetical protein